MTEEKVIRAYIYPCFPNKGKAEKIKQVLKEYRKTAQEIAKFQWNEFFKTGKFNKYLKLKQLKSSLSERYKQTCQWQVVGVLEGYLASIQNEFEKIVYKSNLPQKTKRVLIVINNKKVWFNNTLESIHWFEKGEKIEYEVSKEEKALARKIFKYILSKWKRPSFKNISMHLDSKVAALEENKKSKNYNKWLKIATIEKGKPVLIPLKNNDYAEKFEGELLNFYQVQMKDGKLLIRLTKEVRKIEYRPIVPEIAIDLGLNPLFATDRGDLIGRRFLAFLSKLDEKITRRLSYLQKNEIKPSQDRKYRELVRKLREFLKNEINRYLNRIVKIYRPARIIVERLDFRGQDLSSRMNRLISRFGKRIVNEKLKSLQEIYKIEIIKVNPAYSSQECSSCGYVDKENRKNTQEFECKACGHKMNAQVNGARNILKRRSLGGIKLHTPKKQVLKILVREYLERIKGCNSAPLEVLSRNVYFESFLKPLECG
ncbi:MAG: RNA-guided endonuclease TnpB family protein [Hydrogenobaculum sp.]